MPDPYHSWEDVADDNSQTALPLNLRRPGPPSLPSQPIDELIGKIDSKYWHNAQSDDRTETVIIFTGLLSAKGFARWYGLDPNDEKFLQRLGRAASKQGSAAHAPHGIAGHEQYSSGVHLWPLWVWVRAMDSTMPRAS
ncbi:MAG: hypothetical protein ACT4O0_12725 [Pseudonocardia sp.]